MKFALASALFFLLPPVAFLNAQEQERGLMERIQRPDMQMGNPLQGKTYSNPGSLKIKDSSPLKTFSTGTANAGAKEFAGTRSFFGLKNPWFGNKVYDAKSAALSPRGGSANLSSAFPVRQAVVNEFSGAARKADLASAVVPVRPFLDKGAAQGALDQLSDRITKEMTIDEVRELLNKPR